MGKIILFYKYVHIEYPKRIVKWQQKLCQDLQLRGRILIAHEGINATLGGSKENIDRYKSIMESHPVFNGIDFKESPGSTDSFPRLYITIRDEIVNLGQNPEKITAENGGKHLSPEQTHKLLSNKPEDLVILDARNAVESKIGKFKDAITPDIKHFREFPDYIDNNLEQFKEKQVLMYCTGGIRCERASAYLKSKNIAKNVLQVEGGIHRYVEKYPDGFFRGKNYVFDNRISVKVNDDILGSCELCTVSCDEYTNCLNAQCNKHFISCKKCLSKYANTCSSTCQQLLQNKKAHARPVRVCNFK